MPNRPPALVQKRTGRDFTSEKFPNSGLFATATVCGIKLTAG